MNVKNSFFSVFALAIIVFGSGCTATLSFNVQKPAPLSLPQSVQRLALVNRYQPLQKREYKDDLKDIFSGKGLGKDNKNAEACLDGLGYELAAGNRFKVIHPDAEIKGTDQANFPSPLQAEIVADLCKKFNADALVTVEAFDSETRISHTIRNIQGRNFYGIPILIPEFNARAEVSATVGWRLYDGKTGQLIDEIEMNDNLVFAGIGGTERVAWANLPNVEAIRRDMGTSLGRRYAKRISPIWIRVHREYFTGGNRLLREAKFSVRANDWETASKLWNEAVDHKNRKVRCKAALNMAVYSELFGDLDAALEWCIFSNRQKGNREAASYQRILRRRIAAQQPIN